ncbi:hypothetical protein DRN44_08960 [Thermococci archaeon]|nr:MAG: hypothetical protein DRN44_08960 [Thermococci archaeon]
MERDKEKTRVVIDTNILISALIKDDSVTARIIKSGIFEIYYPEDGMFELEKYRDYIIKKRKKALQKKSFDYALSFLLESVNVVPSLLYEDKIREAYEIMRDIDEKDTPFLALALKLQCPIWSNDGDFEEQNLVEVYKTSHILRKFFGDSK